MAKPFRMDQYKTYDESRGHGSAKEWRAAFSERMGLDEARSWMGNRSPWEVLGIAPDAVWAAVVTAYRAILLTVHPDRCAVHGLSPAEATERSKIVIAAFTMLRERYGR